MTWRSPRRRDGQCAPAGEKRHRGSSRGWWAAAVLLIATPALAANSTLQNPTVTFSTPGSKQVTLNACNAGGCTNIAQTVVVLDPTAVITAWNAVVAPVGNPCYLGAGSRAISLTGSGTGKPPLAFAWTIVPDVGTNAPFPSVTLPAGANVCWNGLLFPGGLYTATLSISNSTGIGVPKQVQFTLPADLSGLFVDGFEVNTFNRWSHRFTGVTQTVGFTSLAPTGAVVGGPGYTPTAVATSGLPATFAIAPASSAVCSLSAGLVTLQANGTCTVIAQQAGDEVYSSAPPVQQSFAVGAGSQAVSFSSSAPNDALVGGTAYAVSATATSGLPVTITVDPVASAICSLSAGQVTFQAVGTCVLDANQPGNASWNPAPQVQQSFAVGMGSQTVGFTSTAPSAAEVGGAAYEVTASATSGLPVTITVDAMASAVCQLSGSLVTFQAAGTCVLDADQPGNANWSPALQAQQSFAVADLRPVVDLDSGAPGSGYATTFTEGGAAVAIAAVAAATVADPDDSNLVGMTVTIGNLLDTGAETLAADTTGTAISALYTPATGVLALTGVDTVAAYQQVLQTVTYANSDTDPAAVPRTIAVVADDGVAISAPAVATVGVVAVEGG